MNKEELDMIGLLKIILEGRKTIIITILLCSIFGIFIYLISPSEYIVKSEMVIPGNQSDPGSKLGRIAALTSFNLNFGGSKSLIKPSLYPSIVQAIPFQRKLLRTNVYSKKLNLEMTLEEYMSDVSKKSANQTILDYTIKLPKRILRSFRSQDEKGKLSKITNRIDSILTISSKESVLISEMRNRIIMDVDLVDGIVSLDVNMQEPEPAAQVAMSVQRLLKEEIGFLKAQNAAEQIKFTEELYLEKKNEFEKIQKKLAIWKDRNRVVSTATAFNEEQNLQSEYNLAFSIYSQVAKQLETKRVEAQENIPSFTVLNPVILPRNSQSPVFVSILLTSIFLGSFLGISIVMFRSVIKYIISKW